MEPYSRATISQVAQLAGVSNATASRALSRAPGVSAPSRAKVTAAAKALGYVPDRIARSMRTQSTGTIGLVVPDLANPFFVRLIESVERVARGRGLSMLLCNSANDPGQELRNVNELLSHRIDGMLISACDRRKSAPTLREAARAVPVVQVDRIAAQDLPFVGVDDAKSVAELVDHLHSLGRTRLAYASSSHRTSSALERYRAFWAHVRVLGIEDDARAYEADYSVSAGRAAAREILAVGPIPEAILCADDLIAAGVIRFLLDHGFNVPEDIAVTGFDDSVIAVTMRPRLTTVRQPLEKVAVDALTLLVEPSGSQGPSQIRHTNELIIRESTSPQYRGPSSAP